MKRTGNLKNKWCTYENLYQSFLEVKKRKSFHANFLVYESNIVCNLSNLLEKLETGTYKTRPYRSFYVYDPKERLIEAPFLEDRIVQHALLRATRDIIEGKFTEQTFACIKGRGTHAASNSLKSMLRGYAGVGYYLKIDFRKYFYTIPHELIMTLLRRIIKCEDTLNLFDLFLRDNNQSVGLPLGSVTSQVLANLALNPIDHFIKRELKIKHYARYMDDLVLLHNDKEVLKGALSSIRELAESMGLYLNNKTKISQMSEGIDFVGYKTHWNRRVIRKRSLYKIRKLVKAPRNDQRAGSYLAHAKHTNSLASVVKILTGVYNDFMRKWLLNNYKGNLNVLLLQS